MAPKKPLHHMTPKGRKDDDERFRKLKPLEQVHELEDLIEVVEAEIDERERAEKPRH